jgi:hypothetical protein
MEDSAKIRTYRRERNEAWLKDHPEERWQCDILPFDGSDHHGIGATESEAIMNAALAYARWQRRPSPDPSP